MQRWKRSPPAKHQLTPAVAFLRLNAAGFNKHLLQPVDLDDLMAALADAP